MSNKIKVAIGSILATASTYGLIGVAIDRQVSQREFCTERYSDDPTKLKDCLDLSYLVIKQLREKK